MASGDNLLHRGKLTRELTTKLVDFAREHPSAALDDVLVVFLGRKNDEYGVNMRLVDALFSLSNDISEVMTKDGKRFSWCGATCVCVELRNGEVPAVRLI